LNVDDIRIRASDLRRQDEVRSVLQATRRAHKFHDNDGPVTQVAGLSSFADTNFFRFVGL
jgi:hypothetical protein